MVQVGLTGWGDHPKLYRAGTRPQDKLQEYTAHFPIVEVDSTFYAIQPERTNRKWVSETPKTFTFIIKAYQGMTGHERGESPYESKEEMFHLFKLSLQPYIEMNKLGAVLFQFPPWFDCRKEHVQYLRYCKQQMGDIPVALEFRHQSWFMPKYKKGTLQFMKDEGWINCIADEPQAGEGSIPTVLDTVGQDCVLIRLHGRNVYGWNQSVAGENWRDVRYLYKYNEAELLEWSEWIQELKKEAKKIYMIFNNNSAGDAVINAQQMIKLLNIAYDDLAPKQLDLF